MPKRALLPALRTRVLTASGQPWRPSASQLQQLQSAWGEEPYKSGSVSRRQGALWGTYSGSADSDFLPDQATIRARSRAAIRNNPLAAGAIQTLVDNVVGTGLTVQPDVDGEALDLSPEQTDRLNTEISKQFEYWACSVEADVERQNTFGDLQRLAFRSSMESGDILSMLPMFLRPGSDFLTKVQLVEADRIENPNLSLDTPTLVAGVKKDTKGAPVSYFVRKGHPGDQGLMYGPEQYQWDEIQAFGKKTGRRNSWLLFERHRPGQTRGIPYLTVALEQLKQLERYTDGELMAAVIGGLFTVFVKSNDTDGAAPIAAVPYGDSGVSASSDTDVGLDYGSIVDLEAGEDIEVASPGRPNTAFADFVRSIVEQIGAGVGLPYELLIKHFTNSYSAARAALLEAWKFFRAKRTWFVGGFCYPVYQAVVTELATTGRLSYTPGSLYELQALCRATWNGPSPGQIDPLKEVNAAKERVALGISTRTRETAEMTGENWDRVARQLKKEKETMEALGLNPAIGETGQPARQQIQGTENNEE